MFTEVTGIKRFGIASGLLFVVLFVAGIVLPGILATAPYVTPFSSTPEIMRYIAGSQSSILVSSFLQGLSAIALIGLTIYLVELIRVEVDNSLLPNLTLSGGLLAAAFLLLSAMFSWTLTQAVIVEQPALVRAIDFLVYLSGGPAHVVWLGLLVGPISLLALYKRSLPRWLGGLGIVIAGFSLLSIVSLVWMPATVLLPLGRFGTFLWVLILSFQSGRKSIAGRLPDKNPNTTPVF